jgi:hypothetical protein
VDYLKEEELLDLLKEGEILKGAVLRGGGSFYL